MSELTATKKILKKLAAQNAKRRATYRAKVEKQKAQRARDKILCTCECGNKKAADDEACARCMYLDGGSLREQGIISALRENGNSTIGELCELLGTNTGKTNGQRSMLRSLQQLVAQKRVRVYERERDTLDTGEHIFNINGASQRVIKMHAAGIVNVYALDGRTQEGR